MSPLSTYGKRPTVLLTNDDGPPSSSSPNIYGFAKLLREKLGWEVRIVVPDCQKSWVGKAYAISDIIKASYFYPLGPDGLKGELTRTRRPLKDGEDQEWLLLSGTPATCVNIALHNLYPGEIDMVISGPNHGRNSSTAFSLSSGTIGAALASSMSLPLPGPSSSSSSPSSSSHLSPPSSIHTTHIPSIAISYGVVIRPTPPPATELAHGIAVDLCGHLWENWGDEVAQPNGGKRPIQLFTVNIPLIEEKLEKGKRKIVWANMWRSTYGSLFQATTEKKGDYTPGHGNDLNKPQKSTPSNEKSDTAGPAAIPTPSSTPAPSTSPSSAPTDGLTFKFAPTMSHLLNPPIDSLPYGSDGWAFAMGYTSVVPLRAEFAGLQDNEIWFEDGQGKRIKAGDEITL